MTDRPTPPIWELEEPPCDFCGASEAEVLLKGRDRLHGLPGEFHVVRCAGCGLARTSPRPTSESLGAAYPEDYAPHRARPANAPSGLLRWALVNYRGYPPGEAAPDWLRGLFALVGKAVLRKRRNVGYLPFTGEGRLLDFGCGGGGYVAKMRAAGWDAEGLDLSPQAIAAGRDAGLTIHQGTLPGADLPAGSYDAVTMWQALEHVPSPKATLAAARDLLKPGGWLLVAVPRFDSLQRRLFGSRWFSLDLPRHLTHFTRATLGRHLEAAGLAVERIHHHRRPAAVRKSFGYVAEDKDCAVCRRLSRSRLVPGLVTYLGLALGRTGQMVAVARRPRGKETSP